MKEVKTKKLDDFLMNVSNEEKAIFDIHPMDLLILNNCLIKVAQEKLYMSKNY